MNTHTEYFTRNPHINWQIKMQSPNEPLIAANLRQFVLYPWGVIDYHLYLASLERARFCETRLNETHLLTTDGFEQISFDELWELSTFDRVPRGTTPVMVFVMLPVPNADGDLPNRKLVLGFDLKTHHLLAYIVDDAPEHISDLGEVWDQRELVIDLDVYRFLEILEYTMEGQREILRVGMFGYFQESTREFQSALDSVIAIQFVQFLNDFVDLLGVDRNAFVSAVKPYEEDLRELICKASLDAWFGANNGESIQQFRRRTMDDLVMFDLVQEPSERVAIALSKVRHLSQGYASLKRCQPRPLQLVSVQLYWPRLILATFIMGFFVSIASQIRFQD